MNVPFAVDLRPDSDRPPQPLSYGSLPSQLVPLQVAAAEIGGSAGAALATVVTPPSRAMESPAVAAALASNFFPIGHLPQM